MFWRKTDKEKLVELLEWFLGHDWKFLKSDYRKLQDLNTLLLRFDTQPTWINFSLYNCFYLKQEERERLLEAYKKLKGKNNERD
ncbi:hypothetical protein [uncultured Campylobacter sp.]|uniref:hypothetical protein n=1 Tax=uncultured Campylobacter sp. TaxID=218934 RepID=UPI0026225941|nr:hypothetical protein [uncultured Campylobacter sp.]